MTAQKQDLTPVANTIRGLAMDAVQKANSGHPGMPMGMAEVAAVLWTEFLKWSPDEPNWIPWAPCSAAAISTWVSVERAISS